MDEKLFPDTSSYYKKTNRRPRGILLIVLLLILLLTGLFVGIRYFGGEAGSRIQGMLPVTPTPSSEPSTPAPTVSEESTPTPDEKKEDPTPTGGKNSKTTVTPQPTAGGGIMRSSLSVSVQNGSGVSGAAGKMATALRELGYTVASTGNADTFDYEDVTIRVKPTKKNFLTQLKSDLSEDFTVTEATADLPGSETSDAVVIVGE